jgi:Protein of unknown function (DUF402)
MAAGTWEAGEVVIWREAWRGRLYFTAPVRVVADDERGLAFYVQEGTRFSFPPGGWPFGEEHPWAAKNGWTGHGVLIHHRAVRDAHTTWHFWAGEQRRFAGWYVNMQEPLRRDESGFETQDQELDIWIEPDGSWRWKDEDQLESSVARGRFTPEEVAAIRAEGERVVAEWPFPTGWEDWEPDPAWPVPELS